MPTVVPTIFICVMLQKIKWLLGKYLRGYTLFKFNTCFIDSIWVNKKQKLQTIFIITNKCT